MSQLNCCEMEADNRTLFIGNIDKNVTEEILYELFLQAGPVERVSIPSSRNDSSRYGFVTYKHECSVNYAIELFKGTNLFKKELSIKKRNPKANLNAQPSNDINKFPVSGLGPGKSALPDFQAQLHSLQDLAQNLSHKSQPLINALKGNWSSRNRPNDFGPKNHFSRPKEIRDRRKERNYGNKLYHVRKNRERHRD